MESRVSVISIMVKDEEAAGRSTNSSTNSASMWWDVWEFLTESGEYPSLAWFWMRPRMLPALCLENWEC